MSSNSSSSFDFSLLSPETRAEITRRFGDGMVDVVTGALRGVAADAERAGLRPEEAVVGFLHLCREMHESLSQAGQNGDERLN